MKYDFKKIGERILDLRNEKKWSQTELCEQLKTLEEGIKYNIDRKTIGKLENGEFTTKNFNIKLILALCEVFNCDLGYLLCEYDFKTQNEQIIHDELGLTDNAIQTLKKYRYISITANAEVEALLHLKPEITDVADNETYIYTLNYIVENYPEIISCIGRILLHDKLNLTNSGCKVLGDFTGENIEYNIKSAALSLAIQVMHIYKTAEYIQPLNISSSDFYNFATSFLTEKLLYLEHENEGLEETNKYLTELLMQKGGSIDGTKEC